MNDLEEVRQYLTGIRVRAKELPDDRYSGMVSSLLTSCNAIERLTQRIAAMPQVAGVGVSEKSADTMHDQTGKIRVHVEAIRALLREINLPDYSLIVEAIERRCSLIDQEAAMSSAISPASSAQVIEVQGPQSSVEIAGRQKGPPALTVKVYAADPVAARNEAVRLYNETVRMLEGHGNE